MTEKIKPGIYVEYIGVSASAASPFGVSGMKHLYLVYQKADGTREVIRGGPEKKPIFGDIALQSGISQEDSEDSNPDGEVRPSKRLDVPVDKLNDTWDLMKRDADEMAEAGLDYDPLVPGDNYPESTSNSVVRRIVEKHGFDPATSLPPGITEKDVPGYENNLEAQMTYDERRAAVAARTREGVQRRKAYRDIKRRDIDLPVTPHTDQTGDARNGNDQGKAEPRLSPEAQKIRGAFGPRDGDDNGPGALMRKRTEDLTEDEISDLHNAAFGERDTDVRHAMQDRLRDFYRLTYGDGPAAHDETGKMIQPAPKRPVPTTPSSAKDAQGRPLADGLEQVAQTLASAAEKDGGQAVVKALQSGLNLMGRSLKVDGDPGSKTRAAVVDAVVKNSPGKIDEARALGAFKSFASRLKTKLATPDELSRIVKKDVTPLLTGQRGGDGADKTTIASTALQQGLNDLKPETKLKEDGVVGPKTTDAFNAAVKNDGGDDVTKSFGRSLGFLR